VKVDRDRTGSPAKAATRRAVGRPTTLEAAPASLGQILALIRNDEANTRPELERISGLSRAMVVDRLAGLSALGLIEQSGTGGSTGGRAPNRIRFRADAGALLLATIDRSSMAVGVADLRGQVLAEHHEETDSLAGPYAVLDRLTTLFLWLMEEHGSKEHIWGIALALPGAVELDLEDTGKLRAVELGDDWQNIDLPAELAYRIGAPAWIRSGTEMMSVGELKAGDGAPDMLFVKLGRSIAAGVVIGDQLHRGVQGAAGLIGHVQTAEISDAVCGCGKRGCLESVVGADAIARDGLAGARGGQSPFLSDVFARTGSVTAADVANGAQLGDAFCADLTARCGRLVGESLAPFANLLNPSRIILGGNMVQAGDVLLAAVREAVYRHAHPLTTRNLHIALSKIGGSAGLIGAAHVAASELFRPEILQRWVPYGSPRRLPEIAEFTNAMRARNRAEVRSRTPVPPPAPISQDRHSAKRVETKEEL
jgi:predicted NBD/HSP70 family sugar kinase